MAMHTVKEFCSCGGRVIATTNIPGTPPSVHEWRASHQGKGHEPCSEARANRALHRQERRRAAHA
jgi:hypothetical protein